MDFEPDKNILAESERELDSIIKKYEDQVSSYFNNNVFSDSSGFYPYLNKQTSLAQDSCFSLFNETFKKILVAAGIPIVAKILQRFSSSVFSFIKNAFSQYKSVFSLSFSKAREAYSEANLRELLFKDIVENRKYLDSFLAKNKDIVISVGKRSFKLSNYLRLVLEQEIRSKFVYSVMQHAKSSGAIGIKISSHHTKTPLCKKYEGRTFLFKNNGLSLLKDGLPPFHVNCKHFIVPVYEH